MSLRADDFSAVFHAIHGCQPFAWQIRLLHEVITDGWPGAIAAPTGAGKTSVLDIALFHLALDAGRPRAAPRRIVFAVDRRIIVDQAHEHAEKLRDALCRAAEGPLARMAMVLRELGGGGAPVHVEQLRGGIPLEDDWARTPTQPTILCTTIDQVGSRLLFRGYGVSRSMAPIHAGLLGEDALILLDEAHLSAAFRETLGWIDARRQVCDAGLGLPWATCALTATPRAGESRVFRLTETERMEPAIRPRLIAAKAATLRLCPEIAGSPAHAEAIVTAALALPAASTVAIVVNRVGLARSVHSALVKRRHRDAILLTGRVRPLDRDKLIAGHVGRLSGDTSAESSSELSPPLFVVATQCIEAGADFSFGAMVTQIASLDALSQRFGRLNRRGALAAAPAVIIATKKEVARDAVDPVYGKTLAATWEWLNGLARDDGSIDASPEGLRALTARDADAASACVPSPLSAPVLRPADIAFFATTSPLPTPDPYLPLFLHGTVEAESDVSIVWRADCGIIAERGADKVAKAIVACMPPRTGEVLRVPLWAARDWLAGKIPADMSDTGFDRAAASDGTMVRRSGLALRWRGQDSPETRLIGPRELRPGDLLIVPSSYGGCDRFGWAPLDTTPVEDIAAGAGWRYRSRYLALRLHPSLWPEADGTPPWAEIWIALQEAAEDGANTVLAALNALDGLPPAVAKTASLLAGAKRLEIAEPYNPLGTDAASGRVLIAPRGLGTAETASEDGGGTPSTETDLVGSAGPGRITLERHACQVAGLAGTYAHLLLGKAPRLAATIDFAATHHDDGKADPRFQLWLAGPGAAAPPLAKSGRWLGAAAETTARRAAGVPDGWRHEALSVRMAMQRLDGSQPAIDPDLALYLIGSHHGQGRPFFTHADPWDAHRRELAGLVIPAGAGPERLDFEWNGRDWTELFASLQARYGVWGLAFLEAVLRLADHRASEAPA